jgi:four helix bundle protein
VHSLTLSFPQIEQYAMAQQLRNATKSIAVNIAEGMGEQESAADVRKFIRIALGSCDETRVWLEFAKDLGATSKPMRIPVSMSVTEKLAGCCVACGSATTQNDGGLSSF